MANFKFIAAISLAAVLGLAYRAAWADQQCYFDIPSNAYMGASPTQGPYSSPEECDAARQSVLDINPSDIVSACRCSGSVTPAVPNGSSMEDMIQQQTMRNWQMFFQMLFNDSNQSNQSHAEQARERAAEQQAQEQALERQREQQAEYQKLCGELKGVDCGANQGLQLKGVGGSVTGSLPLKTGTDFFGTNPSPQGTLSDCTPSGSAPANSALGQLQYAAGESKAAARAGSETCAKAKATAAFSDAGGNALPLKLSSSPPPPPGRFVGRGLSTAQTHQAKALLAQIQQLSAAMKKDQVSYQKAQQTKQADDQALQQAKQSLEQLKAASGNSAVGTATAPDPNLAAAEQLLNQAQENDAHASAGLSQAQQNLQQDHNQFSKLEQQQKKFMSSLGSGKGTDTSPAPHG